jgi:hypothetical protein
MLQKISKIVKWVSLPVLLAAPMLSPWAAAYEGLVNLAICLGCVVLIHRSVRLKEYFRAAGFVGAALIASPLLLVDRIFLLMAIACTVTLMAVVAAFRPQPAAVIPC